jgi:hypothetical protein
MPYVSLAQARKFHSDPKLHKYAAEFDAATDWSHLPPRATKKRRRVSRVAEALMKGQP